MDEIFCPHCGKKHDGIDYIEVGDMEGDFLMECEECEKEFYVEFKTIIKFETKK